jgi:hypothetical protein
MQVSRDPELLLDRQDANKMAERVANVERTMALQIEQGPGQR